MRPNFLNVCRRILISKTRPNISSWKRIKPLPYVIQTARFSPHHHIHSPRRFRGPFFRRWTRRAFIIGLGIGTFYYFMDADFITYFYDLYRCRYNSDGMNDKTIWIIGASSGIGEYLAYDLVKSGAQRIILSARRADKLETVKEQCERIITQMNQQRTQQSIDHINEKIEQKLNKAIKALTDDASDSDPEVIEYIDPKVIEEIKQNVHNEFQHEIMHARSQTQIQCEIIIKPLDMLDFVNNPGSADEYIESLMQDLNTGEYDEFHAAPADIDILVINSGRTQKSRGIENTQSVLLYLQQLNVFAPIALAQAMSKYWINNINIGKINKKNKKLHKIAITSSLAGVIGGPKMSAYCMSKAGIMKYMEAMRMEVVNDAIDVNLVCPGPVALTEDSHPSFGKSLDAQPRSRREGRVGKDMTLERCGSLYTTVLQYSIVESWISNNPTLLLAYVRQYLPILLGPLGRIVGSKFAAVKDTVHTG